MYIVQHDAADKAPTKDTTFTQDVDIVDDDAKKVEPGTILLEA